MASCGWGPGKFNLDEKTLALSLNCGKLERMEKKFSVGFVVGSGADPVLVTGARPGNLKVFLSWKLSGWKMGSSWPLMDSYCAGHWMLANEDQREVVLWSEFRPAWGTTVNSVDFTIGVAGVNLGELALKRFSSGKGFECFFPFTEREVLFSKVEWKGNNYLWHVFVLPWQ